MTLQESALTINRKLSGTKQFNQARLELSERSVELRELLNIPTVVSLSGLSLVIHGSQSIDTLAGVNEIALGRSFDLVDGCLARALGQENDIGAIVDAACDKIGMGFIVAQAWEKGIVPKKALTAIIASNSLNAGLSSIAALRHPETSYRPPTTGKRTMWLYNAGLISYAYAHALEIEHPEANFHQALRRLGAGAIITSTTLAIPTVREYAARALAPK